ncbi:unnamed protein product [Musa textilis]
MSKDKQQDSVNLADLGAALSEEDRAGLVNALKNKLQSLAGKHTDVLETLSPVVRKRVDVLREIQSQHDELEAKFFEERAALEAKYQKLYEPLYTKRYEIVNGVVEVESVKDEPTEETPSEDKASEEKGVPGFWLTAMKTNEVLAEEIQERDEEALKYLKDIKWCRIVDPKGFKLEFFFDPNPYFKNTVLTKTYHMIDEDEPILEKAIGTEIEWFPGKCLTQKILKKKPKKGSKNAKPITKTEDCESFFNFFNPPEVPDDDADIDEETAEQLQSQMEVDYDIGRAEGSKLTGQPSANNSSTFNVGRIILLDVAVAFLHGVSGMIWFSYAAVSFYLGNPWYVLECSHGWGGLVLHRVFGMICSYTLLSVYLEKPFGILYGGIKFCALHGFSFVALSLRLFLLF